MESFFTVGQASFQIKTTKVSAEASLGKTRVFLYMY